jgi:hypothetical protein
MLDADEKSNYDLAAKFYAAKLQLDFHKQEICLRKLEEIMETVYSDIKKTPLYRKLLQRKN